MHATPCNPCSVQGCMNSTTEFSKIFRIPPLSCVSIELYRYASPKKASENREGIRKKLPYSLKRAGRRYR